MSVKNFKFVSPGVFINEIDNSFIPDTPVNIGPVILGRARRGPAWVPTKVESYSEFVEIFGETVPGNGGTDVYRENLVSPMYGTYAAKAFLRANVAPLTYIRLLGQQNTNATSPGNAGTAGAGWRTTQLMKSTAGGGTPLTLAGGAYGLFVFPSSSATRRINAPAIVYPGRISGNLYTDAYATSTQNGGGVNTSATGLSQSSGPMGGVLAAIWYMNSGSIALSGALAGGAILNGGNADDRGGTNANGVVANAAIIGTDANKKFNVITTDVNGSTKKYSFNLDDTSPDFIRNQFNTNPQQLNSSGTFYPSQEAVWLGETYEQFLRAWKVSGSSMVGIGMQGCIMGIATSGSSTGQGPALMKQSSREAVAGWFIGQDQGASGSYIPQKSQKLFRLKGRGQGAWLHRNAKVSIERVRASVALGGGYGSFSIVLRNINDSDGNVQVLERFDNLTLDPTSPSFVARKLGDKYTKWDDTNRVLRTYGEYDNNSRFVYVEMNPDVEAGATNSDLLPIGYFGPPRWKSTTSASTANYYELGIANAGVVVGSGSLPQCLSASDSPGIGAVGAKRLYFLTGGNQPDLGDDAGNTGGYENITASLFIPGDLLRVSASDTGLTDPTQTYFGFMTGRTQTATVAATGLGDLHRLLYSDFPDDPTVDGGLNPAVDSTYPYDAWSYVFSLDDVRTKGSLYYYESGSRARGQSVTATGSLDALLRRGYNRYTAPFWGGFDGWDIQKPDPLYNTGMSTDNVDSGADPTEKNSYIYNTWRRAIDSVADPEQLDMNVLLAPGLTQNSLTKHMIEVCEERADAMTMIDLPNVYIPMHEAYKNDKAARLGTTPEQATTDLKDRRLDSSYGATFYPWVQTRDDETGQMLWIPPTVAMLGVLGSAQKKTDVWFAPAGFNRGGLSEGAAGIPITGITEKLTSKQRDHLYDGKINPIASFPSTGIVVFGQKTLQDRASALDRINVRRLVIHMKKQISVLSTQVLFEQNVQATWNRFTGLIEPFLATVKTRFGITDYKLILDSSTTTPDLIDQNILYAKIMIKPARAIEFIAIDFVIASTGASFDD